MTESHKEGDSQTNHRPITDRRLANLRPPWQAGESGNPAGKPAGCKPGLRAALNRLLRANPNAGIAAALEKLGIEVTGKTVADGLVEVLTKCATAGDISAIRIMFDQTETPLKLGIEVTGADGGPVTVAVKGITAEQAEALEKTILGLSDEDAT